MKNTLKAVLTLAGVVLVATPFVSAQNEQRPPAREGGPGRGRGPDAGMLAEQLGLSADQKAKVEAILQKQRAQMEALAPEERREKGRALREETDKAIGAVLTDAQRKKWEEMRANRPQGGRQGGPGGGEGRRGPGEGRGEGKGERPRT
jgi:Spy/CpxP family protein refolding chaperone